MSAPDFAHLSLPLPKEVALLAAAGYIPQALERIALAEARTEDEALLARLALARARLARLPAAYPYDRAAALALIRRDIPKFNEALFDRWDAEDRMDFVLIEGKKQYNKSFWDTLTGVYPDVEALLGENGKEDAEKFAKKVAHLRATIHAVKEAGKYTMPHRVRAGIRVPDAAFVPGGEYLVHLPIPKPCAPVENVQILATSHTPFATAPEDAVCRTICFREKLSTNTTFWVEYAFDTVTEYRTPDPALVSAEQPTFDTEEKLPHIRFTPYLKALAARLTDGVTNPLEKARALYTFVTTQVNYAYMPPYMLLDDIAETCALRRKGDCGVQALLFITLCRICGIPARFQSGLYLIPEGPGCHDWAQFYVAPFGWLHADLSFGGGAYRQGDAERHAYYFGNLDPFRMVANTDFQAPLTPEKQGVRADPYDNQTGEIEVNGVGVFNLETTLEVLPKRFMLRRKSHAATAVRPVGQRKIPHFAGTAARKGAGGQARHAAGARTVHLLHRGKAVPRSGR